MRAINDNNKTVIMPLEELLALDEELAILRENKESLQVSTIYRMYENSTTTHIDYIGRDEVIKKLADDANDVEVLKRTNAVQAGLISDLNQKIEIISNELLVAKKMDRKLDTGFFARLRFLLTKNPIYHEETR